MVSLSSISLGDQKVKTLPGLLRTHHCGQIRNSDIGQEVTLCGWVSKVRDLGSLLFLDIRDKHGLTQLGFEQFTGDKKIVKSATLESVIFAKGVVRARPANAFNKEMPTGEVEVQVNEFKVLSKAHDVPFFPHAESILATEDHRLKYRYIDLRTQKLQDMLRLRSDVSRATREFLYEHGFIEVETPILYKTTPEGARDYVVPSRVHPGKVYALPQSPQTLKQLLMIGNTDKYFQICRCFRDEDLRADRQPEFTQIDIEVSFATEEYMYNLVSTMVRKWFKLDAHFQIPVLSFDQAMRDYGSDKPDLRFGLKHLIVTDLFQASAFTTFAQVVQSQGLIKAIFFPESKGLLARKDLDGMTEVVKPYGGKGVAWFKVGAEGRSGGIAKFVDDTLYAKLAELSGHRENGTWLFMADAKHSVAHDCANAIRRDLGAKFNLYEKEYAFLWINEFPLLEWSEEDKRFGARHHPFTSPHRDDLEDFMGLDHEKLKACRAQAYDIVVNGYEMGGGSVRIHDQNVQSTMFKALNFTQEETERQFGFFIEALRYGTPPHAGIAFGMDRLVMLLAKNDNIRDVIAFPKTTSATDLMAQAPSVPNKDQLKELRMKFDI